MTDLPDEPTMADVVASLKAGGHAQFRCSKCGWPSGTVTGLDDFITVTRGHKCKPGEKGRRRWRRLITGETDQ